MATKKQRKFTYWVAEHLHDSQCYSIIGRTKRECSDELERCGNPQDFAPPEKREIIYADLFDFFDWVTSEGGGRACGFIPGTNSRYHP